MPVPKHVRRTPAVLVTGVVAVLAASLAVVPSATAASHDGNLVVKGPGGSAYTDGYFVSQVGKEGATLTWTFQVRNTGSTLAQYRLQVEDWLGSRAKLYDGSLLLQPLASSPDGYYTKPLSPGAAQTLTVKITVPGGTTDFQHLALMNLWATDGTYLDYFYMVAEEPAVLAGATPRDLFAKQGSQAAVGGPGRFNQYATAPTISGTQVATFTLILQNSTSSTPTTIGLYLYAGSCGTVTVKDGALDVTAAARAGTYQSPPLARLGKKNLTVTVKNLGAVCAFTQLQAYAYHNNSYTQPVSLLVNKAA